MVDKQDISKELAIVDHDGETYITGSFSINSTEECCICLRPETAAEINAVIREKVDDDVELLLAD